MSDGSRRDIVGAWRDATRKAALGFGVPKHLGPSHAWFHPSHMYDQAWPLDGVSYDGADPRYQDLTTRITTSRFVGAAAGTPTIRDDTSND